MKQKFANALSLALIMVMLFTSLALADDISNNLDADIDATLESLPLTAGGANGSVGLFVQPRNGDGDNGCNLEGSSPQALVVSVSSSNTSVATVSPSQITFDSCGDTPNIIVTPVGAGSATVSLSEISNNSGGTFNLGPASFTVNVGVPTPTDSTPPVIGFSISGTLGNNDWYVTDVFVDWTVTDPDSAVTINEGCVDTTIDYDTDGVTLSCKATSAGGTSTQSVTIKRDATAPTISGTASPAPNGAGWNNSDVAVTFACDDNLSGVASCGPNSTLTSDGSGLSVTGTVVDEAGNSANITVSGINLDKTTPTINGSADRAPNGNGWYNADVTVTFLCTDGGSGIASCSAPSTLGEGANQSVTGTATDLAGNSNSDTVSGINIDETAPTATAIASPAANTFGWNNTDVTVSFNGSDGLSGIDDCSDDVTFSNEGANQSATGTCTDNAGNVSAPASTTVNIDKTAPSVSLVGGPANGGTYYFGFVPGAPTCSASDALSGLNGNCSVLGYSAAIGTHTVTASANDKAGNSANASVTYEVKAWTLRGFYQPVDMNGVYNTVKNGSTVPLKFEIFAGLTELTDVAQVKSLTYAQTACEASATTDEIETVATGGTALRYDTTGGQFIYNWKTPATSGKCYRVTMTTQDGSFLQAFFKLK